MTMKFERLTAYKLALEFVPVERRIMEGLPTERADLGEMLMHHASTITLKIARGTSEPTRAEAYRTFRIAQRSTEFCQSLVKGLGEAGLCTGEDRDAALESLDPLYEELDTIIARIRDKQSPREVFGG
jgi:hypothetical protein